MKLTLRKFRETFGLTQVEVANILDRTQAGISKIDKKSIRSEDIEKLTTHLNAKVSITIEVDGDIHEFNF